MVGPPTVAAFDLDGTLTRRDSLLPFLRFVCGRTATNVALARAVAGARSRHDAKERLISALLSGRALTDLHESADRYAPTVRLRAGVVERLRAHQAAGDHVVIVTASPELHAVALGRHLGVDDVIGTHLEVDASGHLTGRIDGRNCRGDEKVARLAAWLEGRGLSGDIRLCAYGNSRGDGPLLAMAHEPVRVRRVRWRGDGGFASMRTARATPVRRGESP